MFLRLSLMVSTLAFQRQVPFCDRPSADLFGVIAFGIQGSHLRQWKSCGQRERGVQYTHTGPESPNSWVGPRAFAPREMLLSETSESALQFSESG